MFSFYFLPKKTKEYNITFNFLYLLSKSKLFIYVKKKCESNKNNLLAQGIFHLK